MLSALRHVDVWLIDLDNTLYPASASLFDLVDARMTAFIADRFGLDPVAARVLQKGFFVSHGTTLAGLMAEHGVDPHAFLDFVHDVPLDRLVPDPLLLARISRLPGRKLVFTNGDANYAARILTQLGLSTLFEGVHDIHAMALVPKPADAAYAGLCDRWGVAPARALFADDMARNLAPAKALGMTTLWIDNGSEQAWDTARGLATPEFIDYRAHDLSAWLGEILEGPA